ncbi:MAG TPA: ribbon-helix-helix protein, CopG family [Candidatus Aphodousia gallistercoris]|nr:ribbon-helix-helix protein, CopG family [Candidatus Aphodousia gallistercoris]
MSVAISIRLPEFTAKRLDELAKTSHLSKTDLIIQGLEVILASQLDRKITYLTDRQFDDVLNYLNDPTAKDVSNRLSKTMQTSYPWESNNE